MIVYEFKIKAKPSPYRAIDEAILTAQFIRNTCLRYWMNNKGVSKYDLNKYCAVLAKDYRFANELNLMARQSSAERTQLNRTHRRKSKKYRKDAKPQYRNYHKAGNRYARTHLRVSRQRKEYCKRLAYSVRSHQHLATRG